MKIFRGGVVIGRSHWESVRYSWSLAKLIFRDDALVISARFLWKLEYVLDYGSIAAASPKRGFPCGGVAITHRAPDIPPYVVFFAVKAQSVLEEFRRHDILM